MKFVRYDGEVDVEGLDKAGVSPSEIDMIQRCVGEELHEQLEDAERANDVKRLRDIFNRNPIFCRMWVMSSGYGSISYENLMNVNTTMTEAEISEMQAMKRKIGFRLNISRNRFTSLARPH